MGKTITKKYEIYIWTPIITNPTPPEVSNFKLVTGPIIMAETEATIVLLTPKYKNEGSIVLAVKTGSKTWHIGSKTNLVVDNSHTNTFGYNWNLVESLYVAYQKTVKGSQFYKSPDDVPFSVKKPTKPTKKYSSGYGAYKNPNDPAVYTPPSYHSSYYHSPATPAQANETGKWLKCKLSCHQFPAKSQKIKGLSTMTSAISQVVSLESYAKAVVVTEDKEVKESHSHQKGISYDFWGRMDDKELVEFMVEKGFFVRPCPQNPKHGFVDSRVVKAAEEARKIIREVRETGEIPEFIFMEKVDCEYSGVINPDRVTFGRSNDGATAGKGSVEIVLNVDKASEEQAKGSFWTSNEWPYAEMLYAKGEKGEWGRLVQLRSGPKLSGMEEKKVKVTEVHKVDSEMDLIAWDSEAEILKGKVVKLSEEESKVKGYDEEAPVVWHSGGALGSHYGVHCKTGKITLAYVTSSISPKIGEIIEVGKSNPPDLKAVREGLLLGLREDKEKEEGSRIARIEDRKRAVSDLKNFLGALHIFSIADMGDKDTAKFIGYSWGIGLRVIGALPLGEARHKTKMREELGEYIITRNWEKQNKGKKGSTIEKAKEKLKKELEGDTWGHKGWELTIPTVRDSVYHKAWELEVDVLWESLLYCYDGFMPSGGMGWSGGYGGKKWGNCTISLLKCFDKVKEFIVESSDKKLTEMINEINIMVNEAHNGGWWLNKLIQKEVMDSASILPQFLLSPKRAYESKESMLGKFNEKMLSMSVMEMLEGVKENYNRVKKEKKKAEEEAKAKKAEEMQKKYNAMNQNAKDIIPDWIIGDEDSNDDSTDENAAEQATLSAVEIEQNLVELVTKAVHKSVEGKAKVVFGQYKSVGNNFHYQISCDVINREYGYAESKYLSGKCGSKVDEHKYVGKKLTSLTGSSQVYKPVTFYKGEEEELGGVKGVILGVLTGYDVENVGDNLIWFVDYDLWGKFDVAASGEKNKQWAAENIYNQGSQGNQEIKIEEVKQI